MCRLSSKGTGRGEGIRDKKSRLIRPSTPRQRTPKRRARIRTTFADNNRQHFSSSRLAEQHVAGRWRRRQNKHRRIRPTRSSSSCLYIYGLYARAQNMRYHITFNIIHKHCKPLCCGRRALLSHNTYAPLQSPTRPNRKYVCFTCIVRIGSSLRNRVHPETELVIIAGTHDSKQLCKRAYDSVENNGSFVRRAEYYAQCHVEQFAVLV